MKLMLPIAGGLFVIVAAVMSAPQSADAMPVASGAAMAAGGKSAAPTVNARNPRIQCIRAPCYAPRPHRPWHVRHHFRPVYHFHPHHDHSRVVCRIRYGHRGPHQVCYLVPV